MLQHASETRRLSVVSSLCCAINSVATVLILIGWITNTHWLYQPMSDASPVVPLTAIIVLMATISLSYLIAAKAARRVDLMCVSRRWSLIAIALTAATFCEYVFDLNGGLESLFLRDRVAAAVQDVPYPGRLAPQTTLSLLVFCAGIYWLGRNTPRAMRDAGIVIAAGMVIPGVALVGHFINFPALHTFAGFSQMSMAKPTAMLLLMLGAGALALSDPQPYRGQPR